MIIQVPTMNKQAISIESAAARPESTSDIMPSHDLRKVGLQPIMWKTGHSLIKAKMKETGAPLAGEMSGHMFFGGDV